MKFISKSNNLLIVLSQSFQAEPKAGIPARPGVSVRFENGLAVVNDEEICKQLMAHSGFKRDFVLDNEELDPYASSRKDAEPDHVITDMKYGTPGKTMAPKKKIVIPDEMKQYMSDTIKSGIEEGIKSLIPAMVDQIKTTTLEQEAKKKVKKTTKKTPAAKKKAAKEKAAQKLIVEQPIVQEEPSVITEEIQENNNLNEAEIKQ